MKIIIHQGDQIQGKWLCCLQNISKYKTPPWIGFIFNYLRIQKFEYNEKKTRKIFSLIIIEIHYKTSIKKKNMAKKKNEM